MGACDFSASELLQFIPNPALIPNFVRYDWDEAAMIADPWIPDNQWIFKIFIGTTSYRFDFFIIDQKGGRSTTIIDPLGERGLLTVYLDNSHNYDRSIWAFMPVSEMYCELWDKSGTCYFSGFTSDPIVEQIQAQRSDLTFMSIMRLDCKSLYSELEREPIQFELASATLGVALKKAIKRWAPIFDVSQISDTLGIAQPIKWLGITLSVVIERVRAVTDTVMIIEPDTHIIHFVSRNSVVANTGLILDDATILDQFGAANFKVSRDTRFLKTSILFDFNEKYSRGTVDVGVGDSAILGHGSPPQTFWQGRKPGGKIQVFPGEEVYTVNLNESSDDATQTIRISPDYAPVSAVDATDAAYIWTGEKKKIRYDNDTAIRTMQSIRGGGDNGRFVMEVHDDQNAYSLSEAVQQAAALLAMAEPQQQGYLKTDNSVLQVLPLRSGAGAYANLGKTFGVTGMLTFYKITLKANGTVIYPSERQDNLIRPGLDIEIDLTQTFTSIQAQYRGLLQKMQRTKVSDEGEIEEITNLSSLLAIKTCYNDASLNSNSYLSYSTIYIDLNTDGFSVALTDYDYIMSPSSFAMTG